jgi:hypothetical protein
LNKAVFLFSILSLAGAPVLLAQSPSFSPVGSARTPHRVVEFGFDVDAAYANSVLGLADIFNVRKTIVINFDTLPINDLFLNAGAKADAFFNITIGSVSVGLFAGLEAGGYVTASEDLLRFIQRGNGSTRSFGGSALAGGSAFLDAGVKAVFPVRKLRVTARPAVFTPLFYAPPPEIAYHVGTFTNEAGGESYGLVVDPITIDVFSAVSLEGAMSGNVAVDIPLDIHTPLGMDLSVEVLYPVSARLDVGLGIEHIPLFPANLRHRMRMTSEATAYLLDEIIDLAGGGVNMPEAPEMTTVYSDDARLTVMRPLRFDLFAEFRPVEVDLFVLRPSAGFSLLTVYGSELCFNAGVEGQINLSKGFSLIAASAYRERIWRQSLALMVNFRVIELNARISLQGPDLGGSFNGKGLAVTLGLRFGF